MLPISDITLACFYISPDLSSDYSYTESLKHLQLSSKALLTVFSSTMAFFVELTPSPSSRMLVKDSFTLEAFYHSLPTCSDSLKSLMSSLALFKLDDVYHWRMCITGGCVSLEGMYHCRMYIITGRCGLLEGVDHHWKMCITRGYISLEGVYHWGMCITGGCVSLKDVYHWKMFTT